MPFRFLKIEVIDMGINLNVGKKMRAAGLEENHTAHITLRINLRKKKSLPTNGPPLEISDICLTTSLRAM